MPSPTKLNKARVNVSGSRRSTLAALVGDEEAVLLPGPVEEGDEAGG